MSKGARANNNVLVSGQYTVGMDRTQHRRRCMRAVGGAGAQSGAARDSVFDVIPLRGSDRFVVHIVDADDLHVKEVLPDKLLLSAEFPVQVFETLEAKGWNRLVLSALSAIATEVCEFEHLSTAQDFASVFEQAMYPANGKCPSARTLWTAIKMKLGRLNAIHASRLSPKLADAFAGQPAVVLERAPGGGLTYVVMTLYNELMATDIVKQGYKGLLKALANVEKKTGTVQRVQLPPATRRMEPLVAAAIRMRCKQGLVERAERIHQATTAIRGWVSLADVVGVARRACADDASDEDIVDNVKELIKHLMNSALSLFKHSQGYTLGVLISAALQGFITSMGGWNAVLDLCLLTLQEMHSSIDQDMPTDIILTTTAIANLHFHPLQGRRKPGPQQQHQAHASNGHMRMSGSRSSSSGDSDRSQYLDAREDWSPVHSSAVTISRAPNVRTWLEYMQGRRPVYKATAAAAAALLPVAAAAAVYNARAKKQKQLQRQRQQEVARYKVQTSPYSDASSSTRWPEQRMERVPQRKRAPPRPKLPKKMQLAKAKQDEPPRRRRT